MIYYVLCFSFMFLQVLARQAKKVIFLVWHSAKFERKIFEKKLLMKEGSVTFLKTYLQEITFEIPEVLFYIITYMSILRSTCEANFSVELK